MCWSVYTFIGYHINCFFSYSDINECTENDDICGLGTCINIDENTLLYECDCSEGSRLSRMNTDGTLTCDGVCSILFVCSFYPHVQILMSV